MQNKSRTDPRERVDGRLTALTAVVVAVMCMLGWRLYSLQMLQGGHYERKATLNFTRFEEIPATRGRIFDREGRILVDTVRTYALAVDTLLPDMRRVPREKIRLRLRKLAEVVDASPEVLLRRYESGRVDRDGRVVVLRQIPYETLVAVQERRFELPGIRVVRSFRRFAVHHDRACHLLGYVNEISAAELESARYKDRLRRGDELGRAGVEETYDEFLRGEKGRRKLKVHNNEIVEQELERIESKPGGDLHLTLDLRLQAAAEDILGTSPGALVVLDCRTGAVLAMASFPRYDPNLVGTRAWVDLLNDPGKPLVHRAIAGAHAPGSVLKIAMAIAGLTDNKITPKTHYYCSGRFTKLGSSYQPRCWIGGKYGWGHGSMDIEDALKQSCDVYFYQLGLLLKRDGIRSWGSAFGFGAKTGIDIPGEKPGRLPNCDYPGEIVQAAIGQERWLSTPLQVALMTATVANGGYLFQPHVGDIVHRNGEDKAVHPIGELVHHQWPEHALEHVRHAMWRVVQEPRGTAYSQRIEGFEYAGKTGSAEAIKGHPTHSWFTAYAPYDEPTVAIAAFAEFAGHGSEVAAPMTRKLLQHIFPQARDQEGT